MMFFKTLNLVVLVVVLTWLGYKVDAAGSLRDDWFKNSLNSEDIEFLKAPLKPSNNLKQQTNSNIWKGLKKRAIEFRSTAGLNPWSTSIHHLH